MKNLDKYVSDSYKLSLDECFGYWIHNGVWYGDEDLTFDEAKEVFFLTLKKLLDDNKVVLCPPIALKNEPVKNQYDKKGKLASCVVWNIPSKEIIQYMRDAFPKDIEDENDRKLIDFWFSKECPQIGWVDQQTGEIVD